ncbi:MAG: hydrogenase [Verrucomicrobia bacterium CG_4_10_14_3_um_filter_43_23]|nr:MAG: hypothetical protein AUJ82_05320 [Verrucomicrobia bacterium CG1_02_43_26]PIP58746.1 MAG: hydrogenase [Verrucomicrobia bacterium CG22_combo_CG10-13_8_21_14_all_43_17]PIX58208.1 MAG: hydrogenase [Verrucomicrobia bacterium CG_4_10_14_3_um_filter_43_23]PIY61543.1 MAG: hydrogenase [Verrucomicrobia bacterium CG_4_10_14_0_8_um_filter_43_34]PJA44389.1 MAG: hydrogenase [Verrucomicrobia bacterium CG_4_9_14_3_um_filter_43_20]
MKSDNLNNDKENKMPQEETPNGRNYWRSLDELTGAPEFKQWLDREFPEGASEINGVDRRQFMKIMAASFALAGVGLAGCRQQTVNVLPYSKQPERIVPGVPIYYTSSMPSAKDNIPLLVETHDARPTKIEGNPSYLAYNGATDTFSQASILNLYDPDRAQRSMDNDKGKALSKAEVLDLFTYINHQFSETQGEGLAVLAEPSSSPTRARLVNEFKKKFPKAVWAEYDPTVDNSAEKVLGRFFQYSDPLADKMPDDFIRPQYHFENAKRILAIDSDFLHSEPGQLGNSRAFANARRVHTTKDASKMNRLYAVESNFTLTGGMADHRLRLPASHATAFTHLVAAEIFELAGWDSAVVDALRQKGSGLTVDHKWIKECARDLYDYRKQSLIIAGDDMPEDIHFLVMLMNNLLSAEGETVSYSKLPSDQAISIKELADLIKKGTIGTLVVLGGNPVYNAPADLNWPKLQKSINRVTHLSYYFNETSKLANEHIAANHYLESWGDGRAYDGTYVPVQPMILPLFDGFTELELLAKVLGLKDAEPYGLVRETFESMNPNISIEEWLGLGVLKNSEFPYVSFKISRSQVENFVERAETISVPQLSEDNLEVRLVLSNQVLDGRYNNNGWLQELPDPLTKLTWDNAISISPRLAKELTQKTGLPIVPKASLMNELGQLEHDANSFLRGKEQAFVAELTVNGKTVKGPLHVQPGLADYTLVIPVGYGRTVTGNVGSGTGFDAYPLSIGSINTPLVGARLKISDEIYELANTQEHWSMEGRAILRESTADDYAHNPDFVNKMGVESHSPAIYGTAKNDSLQKKVTEIPRGGSLYKTPDFTGAQQWGMSIDLNTCTGCNACVVACQSENNIPIIGKDQVLRGREMHWIRMDRYFSSNDNNTMEIPEDPQVSFMSMLCQHCELAPCETVCPVNATVHDESGLNVMAYNRCVGTRYCANNCPYKVRRFNFFDWNKREIDHFYEGPMGPSGMPELHKMQKNPNVTVRMRGVMEKCTFCVQRIEAAKINQRVKAKDSPDVMVPDGAIKTACQQVCPTESIVFGDVADANTRVSKLKGLDMNYSVLGYLNTRPRTTYLAKLRNPNPLMPDYYPLPNTRSEYEKRYGHGVPHEAEVSHN